MTHILSLKRFWLSVALMAATTIALLMAFPFGAAQGADHLDAPLASADGRVDINDLYVFSSPSDSDNAVLVMTVNPLAGVLSPTTFHPKAKYEFLIDEDGDAKPDQVYTVKFGRPDEDGVQRVSVRGKGDGLSGKGDTSDAIISLVGKKESRRGRRHDRDGDRAMGSLRAGVFDDPFFFDLVAFQSGLAFCPGGVGTDFFAGLNVSAIILEVPKSTLTDDGGSTIGVWARTVVGRKQVDRIGRPAINTVFIPAGMKDDFNAGKPRRDVKVFTDEVVATLMALGNDLATSEAIAAVLLPDILTVDLSLPTVFLNGRGLADDVIDAELALISGGAIPTDCVPANDVPFSAAFPYLGAAH